MRVLVIRAEHADPTAGPGAIGRYRNVSVVSSETAVPTPRPGEALVKVHTVATCGTDVHAVQPDAEGWCRSSVPAAGWERPEGLIMGHEYTGRVVAAGEGVPGQWLRRSVTGDSLVPCRRCALCAQGSPNECPDAYLIGFAADGVFAEYAAVPVESLHGIEALTSRFGEDAWVYGCLAEPLGVATKAVNEALSCLRPRADRSVLIHGGGPLGACVGVVARALGCEPIVVVEPLAARRAALTRSGITAFDLHEWHQRTHRELFGPGATVVVDACGVVGTPDLLSGLRPGGALVCLARTGQVTQIPQDWCITRGVKLVFSRGHVGYVPRVLGWLATGRIDPSALVTHRLQGLDELGDWLRHPERFENACKVVCRIGG
jgi:L-gulonate 5-dehydrogenase